MDPDRGQLYIGIERDEPIEPLLYDSATLTTHGVIVGMTGSGKTGLGFNILEESLLNRIPALILDPKGDMGNLLLLFPDHDPEEYEPWIDPAEAERKGLTVAELATKTAAERRDELADHGIDETRLARLRDQTDMTIYTPGSSTGVGLNVLGSMEAPDLDWAENAELIRDEIEALISSLLLLADIDSDPISGPEHILLSTIVETWWRQNKDLDLATLVGQIPKPPFRKLGVFDLDTFFPRDKRTDLALKLNGLLASPAFSSWLEGEPLDIESMINGGDKTKCAIVYMAHLTDAERQFVATLILSKLVTWIRRQPGSSELRALAYLDEAVGYAPPTAEPPSKKPIMTILKQARAFGVGMILVTQNPVDLDHKAMSNSGTWVVGRLQTDNDKRRILDAMETTETDLDTLISDLQKRQFLLHVVKKKRPKVFKRRRAMSFRVGPLTRNQVALLMDGKKPVRATDGTGMDLVAEPEPDDDHQTLPVAPVVAEGVPVRYLDPAAPWARDIGADPTGTRFEPAAAVTVQLLYDDTRAGIHHNETYEAVVFPLDATVDPADVHKVDHDERDLTDDPPDFASYATSEVKLQNKSFWTRLQSDIKGHLLANVALDVFHNPDLGIYSRVGETEEEFRARCASEAATRADAEMANLTARYKTRIERVKDQISTADARVGELEGEVSAKKQEEVMSGAGDLLGALLGGRKSSNPLGKAATRRAATRKAEARADAAAERLTDKKAELVDLEAELAEALADIAATHDAMADNLESTSIGLERTDIRVAEVKLVWIPVG
ncbi:MAG: DUF87 domain-containing protein [Acidimicrobiia bacterium]|nr:DUF87 domain-containing protein [Acidimicrobiia bacterium]